jgi:hypothetical protein
MRFSNLISVSRPVWEGIALNTFSSQIKVRYGAGMVRRVSE